LKVKSVSDELKILSLIILLFMRTDIKQKITNVLFKIALKSKIFAIIIVQFRNGQLIAKAHAEIN